MSYLQEEIETLKSRLDQNDTRRSNDEITDSRFQDISTRFSVIESRIQKYDDIFNKLLDSMTSRDKRMKDLE